MARLRRDLYPDYTAEIRELDDKGFSLELLYKIIEKHKYNSEYNKKLYERYMGIEGAVPIMNREPRFDEAHPINNKLVNDFFGEIIDFETGYFAGMPFAYGYNKGEEAAETTGGEKGIDIATKAVTDFTTRNNMYGVDMEISKFANISGYAGRLFYIDKEGMERVMSVPGFETIVLSSTSIVEPEYAVRYYYTENIAGSKEWTVEFYDSENITIYVGSLSDLKIVEIKPHMFDYCPLQAIPKSKEMLGSAEKVLTLIDDYDKVLSDNSNEIEAFVHSYMVFENLNIDEETIRQGQQSGSFSFRTSGTQAGKAYFLTKDINDNFTEHHLERLEDNIRHLSSTPNLSDDSFGTASGESLKFKLHGVETKCGMFQAQMMSAAQYMWKLLSSSWAKKKIVVDPLQVTIEFKRNFPLNLLAESQAAQALLAAGVPFEYVMSLLSFVDDPDYIMELKEKEQQNIPDLEDVDDDIDDTGNTTTDDELNTAKTGKEKIQLLNGAQIQALTGIIRQVQQGEISRKAAITIAVSSLGISRANAEAMIEEKLS